MTVTYTVAFTINHLSCHRDYCLLPKMFKVHKDGFISSEQECIKKLLLKDYAFYVRKSRRIIDANYFSRRGIFNFDVYAIANK